MRQTREFDVVTGAFGYIGKHIAQRLLAAGKEVRTLTSHPNRPNPFGDQVSVRPYNFEDPTGLARSLEGATTLYNTYWVRFPHGQTTFELALENSRRLVEAAKTARVRRIVHISITNPSPDSPLPYFRGKAAVEKAIADSGLAYAIVRPTLTFGGQDILINNIAWLLRRFPVFAVPGSGDYKLQPVFVEDLAAIAVGAAEGDASAIADAVGPEVYTFNELLTLLARAIGSKARIVHTSKESALIAVRLLGWLVRDVVLTRDEVEALTSNLLVSSNSPLGPTLFSEWLRYNSGSLGRRYASELGRHFRG